MNLATFSKSWGEELRSEQTWRDLVQKLLQEIVFQSHEVTNGHTSSAIYFNIKEKYLQVVSSPFVHHNSEVPFLIHVTECCNKKTFEAI